MATSIVRTAYDGTAFAGWARQPEQRTVQGELERALAVLRGGEPVSLVVAGRTDAGVHALAQVASYTGEPVVARALASLLPEDIGVLACEPAPDGFDARHDARARSYLYRVHAAPLRDPFRRHHALWWPHAVDRGALEACAEALVGEHDFTAFTPTATDHVHFRRTVLCASWTLEGDELHFAIEADAFMRHMNRVLVGTMLEVAGGRRSVEDFATLLAGAPRSAAGVTAPPHGLHFAGARYEARSGDPPRWRP